MEVLEATVDVATIEAQALKLNYADREHLAAVLFRSLEGFGPNLSEAEFDAAWKPELDRRMKEWDDDPSFAISHEDVMKSAREFLK